MGAEKEQLVRREESPKRLVCRSSERRRPKKEDAVPGVDS